jgi:hypothetical protein
VEEACWGQERIVTSVLEAERCEQLSLQVSDETKVLQRHGSAGLERTPHQPSTVGHARAGARAAHLIEGHVAAAGDVAASQPRAWLRCRAVESPRGACIHHLRPPRP